MFLRYLYNLYLTLDNSLSAFIKLIRGVTLYSVSLEVLLYFYNIERGNEGYFSG